MNDWLHDRLYEYWDHRVDAVGESAGRLRALSGEQREHALSELREAVLQHCDQLGRRDLVRAAITMAEDLYKAINVDQIWDESMQAYLHVTAGTFGRVLAERELYIRYVIDNTFEPTEDGLVRPLVYFRIWFGAAGFVYICPQESAKSLMEHDGIEGLREVIQRLPQYIAEGRYLADRIVKRAQAERRHYVFLDTDSVPGVFDAALQEDPNAITMYRSTAPVTDSLIDVVFPAGVVD